MNHDDDELARRMAHTLDHSVDALDADTVETLARARAQALASGAARTRLRPALVAASLVALVVVPWLSLRSPAPTPALSGVHYPLLDEVAETEDAGYLSEDPDMLAHWDMLEAIGEVPDA